MVQAHTTHAARALSAAPAGSRRAGRVAGRCAPRSAAACVVRSAAAPAPAVRRAVVPQCLAVPLCRAAARRGVVARAGQLEGDDVGNMLPIDADSDGGVGGTSERPFGPDAVLLVGFLRDEVPRVRAALDELGADFVRVVVATRGMLDGTLGAALETPSPLVPQPPATGVPRVFFCSGMSSAELMSVIHAVEELELPPCTFAAAVPRSVDKTLSDVLDEISGDAERMAAAERR
jgi:hypothetical protein